MTRVAGSAFFARCAERAICWNQCHEGRPYGDSHGLNRLLGPDYSEFDLCFSFYLEVPEVETGEDQKE